MTTDAPVRRRRRHPFVHVALILICVVFAYPLVWMVLGAFKTQGTFYSDLWGLPDSWHWSNFSTAWSVGHIGRYLLNSVVVTGLSVILVLLLGYPLAYALARMRFPGNRAVLGLFAVTLFVPIQLLLIPIYELELNLNIVNTYWALILPYAAGALPFAVIFASTYLRSIPIELEEQAEIDGASRGRILVRIIVPLSRPALATVVVFTFLNVWNEFVIALTVSQSDSVRTLPVGLLNFSQQFGTTNYPELFAALTLSAAPVIGVFLLCQRQFIQGLVAGAVKI
jgi:ABC-type glycerol-3-phosphate transport system permease component